MAQSFFKKNKSLVTSIAIIILIVLGGYAISKVQPQTGSSNKDAILTVKADDHTKGNGTVILMEYSDFQCPACASYSPAVKQLINDFPDQIKFVYRHFPLYQIHKNAKGASYAAESASNQGKFWEMHDLLFANQSSWGESNDPEPLFREYAKSLTLNEETFVNDMKNKELRAGVDKDLMEGTSLGVNSTPTFFINGNKLQDIPRTYEGFKTLIEAEIARQGVTNTNVNQ